ncbi:MAG: hypothetical protein K9N51_07810 [Candidatus Pacebacteria bacterium]|nr:hypothetical protein [Candidatus Paceibacterota bacterium]
MMKIRVTRSNISSQSRATVRQASLVEVLVAVLLLTVLAIVAGAYISNSRIMVSIQRDRRAALGVAEARLEDLRATRGNFFSQLSSSSNSTYFVTTPNPTDWILGDSETWKLTRDTGAEISEQVEINGRNMLMVTQVHCLDLGSFGSSCECVAITVSVRYRVQSDDTVTVHTRMARPI